MVLRTSSDSERKILTDTNGRYEARLGDGGWVVYDVETSAVAVSDGRRLDHLTDTEAHTFARGLNGRQAEKPQHAGKTPLPKPQVRSKD